MRERLLITGASGLLGAALGIRLHNEGHEVLGIRRSHLRSLPFPEVQLDLADESALHRLTTEFRPTVVVHAAALSQVLACEQQPDEAFRQNVNVTKSLVECASNSRAYFLFVSTDQVFDGICGKFTETDRPLPTHVYGKTKHAAERLVEAYADSLILRSNNIVGQNVGWGRSFTDGLLANLRAQQHVELFADQFRSPIHLRSLVEIISLGVEQRINGILHAGGPERLSRYETGYLFATIFGFNRDLLIATSMQSHPQAKSLHCDSSFVTDKLISIFPTWAKMSISEGFAIDVNLS